MPTYDRAGFTVTVVFHTRTKAAPQCWKGYATRDAPYSLFLSTPDITGPKAEERAKAFIESLIDASEKTREAIERAALP